MIELKRIFAEQGVTDHVEVAQAAASALGSTDEPGEIALMLDYRIRHILPGRDARYVDWPVSLIGEIDGGLASRRWQNVILCW